MKISTRVGIQFAKSIFCTNNDLITRSFDNNRNMTYSNTVVRVDIVHILVYLGFRVRFSQTIYNKTVVLYLYLLYLLTYLSVLESITRKHEYSFVIITSDNVFCIHGI